jgi:hypothetical protein
LFWINNFIFPRVQEHYTPWLLPIIPSSEGHSLVIVHRIKAHPWYKITLSPDYHHSLWGGDTLIKAKALETLLYFPSNTMLQSTWLFKLDYFNPTPRLTLLLFNIRCSGTALTTSPQANSFDLSGISSLIPAAYSMFLKYLLRAVMFAGRSSEVTPRDRQRDITSKPGG